MDGNQAFARTHCSDLRGAYRAAFSRWTEEMNLLQAYVADPTVNSATLESAALRSRLAEEAYRNTRDALWHCMRQ